MQKRALPCFGASGRPAPVLLARVLLAALACGSLGVDQQASGQEPNRVFRSEEPFTGESLALTPDGKVLASGGGDRTARLWDAATGKELATLRGHTYTVNSIAFSPDGHVLATANSGREPAIRVWDVATRKCRVVLRGHDNGVRAVVFGRDGKTLISAGAGREWDGEIIFWDSTTGEPIRTIQRPHTSVWALALGPDGTFFASGGKERKDKRDRGEIKLWETSTGKLLATLKGHRNMVMSLAISRDGKSLASGTSGGAIGLWDLKSRKERFIRPGHGDDEIVNAVAFSADGRHVVTGSHDNTIAVWDATSGAKVTTVRRHEGVVRDVLFSPDGRWLYTGSDDMTILAWEWKELLRAAHKGKK